MSRNDLANLMTETKQITKTKTKKAPFWEHHLTPLFPTHHHPPDPTLLMLLSTYLPINGPLRNDAAQGLGISEISKPQWGILHSCAQFETELCWGMGKWMRMVEDDLVVVVVLIAGDKKGLESEWFPLAAFLRPPLYSLEGLMAWFPQRVRRLEICSKR